jgi:hypothetical protein
VICKFGGPAVLAVAGLSLFSDMTHELPMRGKMSEWVLHCAIDQRHIRRSQPTRDAALEDACSQLLQGHAVNRIIGPNETINAQKIKEWCAKHGLSHKIPRDLQIRQGSLEGRSDK